MANPNKNATAAAAATAAAPQSTSQEAFRLTNNNANNTQNRQANTLEESLISRYPNRPHTHLEGSSSTPMRSFFTRRLSNPAAQQDESHRRPSSPQNQIQNARDLLHNFTMPSSSSSRRATEADWEEAAQLYRETREREREEAARPRGKKGQESKGLSVEKGQGELREGSSDELSTLFERNPPTTVDQMADRLQSFIMSNQGKALPIDMVPWAADVVKHYKNVIGFGKRVQAQEQELKQQEGEGQVEEGMEMDREGEGLREEEREEELAVLKQQLQEAREEVLKLRGLVGKFRAGTPAGATGPAGA